MILQCFKHPVTFITLLLLSISCTKEQGSRCEKRIELNDRGHLADLSPLNQAPELLDTLAKYPQLRVFKVIDGQHAVTMQCDIFYKQLIVFTYQYVLSKGKKHPVIGPGSPDINDTIPLSLEPAITAGEAIRIAGNSRKWGTGCITYRLGIYRNGTGVHSKEFRLVWKLKDEQKFPEAIVDAHSGELLYSHDGIDI